MKRLVIIWLLAVTSLYASKAEYHIKSLGLKVAYISFEYDLAQNSLHINTHSLKTNALFPQINNTYKIDYDDNIRPLTSQRIVRQKNHYDNAFTRYQHFENKATLNRALDGSSHVYSIAKNTRDIFSFLIYLSSGKAQSGVYNIDGNGLPWKAKVIKQGKEAINTSQGKFNTQRYDVSFENVTGVKMPYVDMVTHNTLNEKNKLTLWIADNYLTVKAVSKKSGITATWELINYTP